MSRILHDTFFKQAKKEGYIARSAYKLMEIQRKHKVIPTGGSVLDLGCSPGAWLQVACQSIGPPAKGGAVVGIDLTAMKPPSRYCDARVHVLHGDARDLTPELLLEYTGPRGYDAVLSDMCHATHGNAFLDATKSLELAELAWAIAVGAASEQDGVRLGGVLRPGGALVIKVLQGGDIQDFAKALRQDFTKVAFHRPKATRSESKEVYVLGLGKKSGDISVTAR